MGPLLWEASTSSDFGRLLADCELDEWKMEKAANTMFRAEVHKTQILLDQTDIILMSDHLDIYEHIYRD